MTPVERYQAMNSDPEFAALDYAEQTQIRAAVVNSAMASDPGFATLPQSDREQLFQDLVYAPPALQDKVAEAKLRNVASRADAGDTTVDSDYNELYSALNQTVNGGLFVSAGMRAAKELGMVNQNAEVFGRTVYGHAEAPKMFQYLNARKEIGRAHV